MKRSTRNIAYKKNVSTLPTPNMPAAQALPSGWSSVGKTSTNRARSAAWTALMEKSIQKIEKTAKAMVRTLFWERAGVKRVNKADDSQSKRTHSS